MKTTSTLLLLVCLLIQNARAFRQTPKFTKSPFMLLINDPNFSPTDGYFLNVTEVEVPEFVREAFQGLRALGLWAFYSAANFDSKSMVTPINGEGKYTAEEASVIKEVMSAKALSDPNNVQVDRFEAFSGTYFLGDSTGVLDNSVLKNQSVISYRSLAIYTYTRHVIMCREKDLAEDNTNCFCLNGLIKDSYLIPDLKKIQIDNVDFGDIRKIRQLDQSEEGICDRLKPLCESSACIAASGAI